MQSNTTPKTSRHFNVGTAVYHKTHGHGVIMARDGGEKYPYFASTKTTGTASTRVYALDHTERS
jgi:hypothetical protein